MSKAVRIREIRSAGIHTWTLADELNYHADTPVRVLPTRSRPGGVELTWSDYFCGAGGSSWGILGVPGSFVHMAVNHWDLAIQTHNYNLPEANHDSANVARTDPKRYPRTDCAWFSPECTYWSVARGRKCDYDDADEVEYDCERGLDPQQPPAEQAKWRSRMLMRDVVRFARHHQYRAVIVENVPDILKWAHLDRWLQEMVAEGYRYKVITLNSAFAHGMGDPAPQLRDRVYVVFWKVRYRTPDWDKWLRPAAWCPTCEQVVRGIYTPKPGRRRPMRYRSQYFYRCPQRTCGQVQPYALPALAALDLSVEGTRIGDRKVPLKPNTYQRIEVAMRRFWPRPVAQVAGRALQRSPLLVPAGGTWRRGGSPGDRPMPTRTTRENDALLIAPLVVPVEGRAGVSARPAMAPLRTQTGRHQDALVVPLRNNGVGRPAHGWPAPSFAAGGYHHALVSDAHEVVYSYDTGLLRPLAEPMPTQTTVEGDAVVGPATRVQDCTLRMFMQREIQRGMGFHPEFVLLGTAKRDNVAMLGNAVTKGSAADLVAAVTEAVTGRSIELADFGPPAAVVRRPTLAELVFGAAVSS